MTRAVFRYKRYTTRQDQTVEPEYSAHCVAGDEEPCRADSGVRSDANDVDDWMRDHMKDTGHRNFRRRFDDFAELTPTDGLPAELEPPHVEPVKA